jgi:hypothetical protein
MAYVVILLGEHVERLDPSRAIQIWATDLSEQALQLGKQGWYPEGIAGYGRIGPDFSWSEGSPGHRRRIPAATRMIRPVGEATNRANDVSAKAMISS